MCTGSPPARAKIPKAARCVTGRAFGLVPIQAKATNIGAVARLEKLLKPTGDGLEFVPGIHGFVLPQSHRDEEE